MRRTDIYRGRPGLRLLKGIRVTSKEVGKSLCPISAALAIIGDRWTILILKELALGVHRFEEIQAQVGASPFLLSSRLKRLRTHGIIERRAYCSRPPRYEYYPTEKGRCIDPIIASYLTWGATWEVQHTRNAPAFRFFDTQSGHILDLMSPTPLPHFRFGDDHIRPELSAQYIEERASRRAAFFAGRRTPRKT
jgi:DNA-binding HxlR family transcriptional regulator